MTERLYYTDSYTTDFTARIIERRTHDDRPAVILDRTYFYPTGGGQPHDVGFINDANVIDVFTDDNDLRVVHILNGDIDGDEAVCKVDWARRFDHMQHHTGQHILTQAFVQTADANTVGFHLSANSVTIDLDRNNLSAQALLEAETLANRIVQANRPVTVRIISPDDAEAVRIRKMPEKLLTDGLRVIDVADFDMTACGGTHVAHTGEIGLIKIIKSEKRGDKLRVEFRCGARAVTDYHIKNAVVNRLMAALNCGADELEANLEKLRAELKETRQAHKAARSQLLAYEAETLLADALQYDGFRLIKVAFDGRPIDEVRMLTGILVREVHTVVLAGTAGEKAQVMLARSDDLTMDMNPILQQILPLFGDGRGGGKPGFVQGGGVPADVAQMQAALDKAEALVLNAGFA